MTADAAILVGGTVSGIIGRWAAASIFMRHLSPLVAPSMIGAGRATK